MMGVITLAKRLLERGEVKIKSMEKNRIIVQAGDNLVILERKSGYVLDSCSCQNHAKFNKLNPRCSHKLAAVTFLVMRGLE